MWVCVYIYNYVELLYRAYLPMHFVVTHPDYADEISTE